MCTNQVPPRGHDLSSVAYLWCGRLHFPLLLLVLLIGPRVDHEHFQPPDGTGESTVILLTSGIRTCPDTSDFLCFTSEAGLEVRPEPRAGHDPPR